MVQDFGQNRDSEAVILRGREREKSGVRELPVVDVATNQSYDMKAPYRDAE